MKDSENPGNVQARRCNCWDGSHFPGPSCGLPLVVDDISPTAFSFQTGCREILMIARVDKQILHASALGTEKR
ncbi:hypothetical protein PVK06_015571 [Gossypium arboreum]|uniref:Uncharacterized protein n=1 Tax=Gossypium arboreum TaxID=29729 RepID=A0ABR0PY82_GOSAR|nr:hypothetical protein PVK06_015571 [Gossypium arboreum]